MRIDHVTYTVPPGTFDNDDLYESEVDNFFGTLGMKKVPADEKTEKDWTVRWYTDGVITIHLVENRPPPGETIASNAAPTVWGLNHFAIKVPKAEQDSLARSVFCTRDAREEGSSRIWLTGPAGIRVEVGVSTNPLRDFLEAFNAKAGTEGHARLRDARTRLEADIAAIPTPLPPDAVTAWIPGPAPEDSEEHPIPPALSENFDKNSPAAKAIRETSEVLEEALGIYVDRFPKYRDNWRRYGWRGSLFNLRRKVERAWDLFWDAEENGTEDVDDLLDVIVYAATTIRALREHNRDGEGNWWKS